MLEKWNYYLLTHKLLLTRTSLQEIVIYSHIYGS